MPLPATFHLLQERDAAREAARWTEWREVRDRLREVLHRHLPGHRIWLFGSVTKPGQFNVVSDVDLAVEEIPAGTSIETLTAVIGAVRGVCVTASRLYLVEADAHRVRYLVAYNATAANNGTANNATVAPSGGAAATAGAFSMAVVGVAVTLLIL